MLNQAVVVAHGDSLARVGLKALIEASCADVAVDSAEDFVALVRFVDRRTNAVLLVDIDLSGMNGMAGIGTLLRRKPIPVTCLIMPVVTREIVARCVSLGISACIERSRLPEEVCNALAALADRRFYFSRLTENRPASLSAATPTLTQQQLNVLRLLAAGKSNKQIGRDLGICEGTVKAHLNAAYRALGVGNRISAASKLRELSRGKVEERIVRPTGLQH